uniref:putative polysaccharide biosynthesis protein n=1 Tax=Paenibacillus koleovorans TaxID=121608 RepID=UPI002482412E|nr:polysaccharide biosynthesis protein [Paenibacillus koleovorans]
MSKDSLVKGTLILAMAALIARVLGAVQRIPLVALLDDAGMATYSIAFNIYSFLLVVATAGIPSALSKLVSEQTALGQHAEANRIYRAATWFAVGAGVVMTLLLLVFAPYYAKDVSNDPDAVAAIRALAPALLLFPLIAIMRGYFQGRQRMMPNGLSQIIEQILRLVTAVGLAYLLLKLDYGHVWAVAGASFGGVMGSVGAIAVMVYFAMKLRRADMRSGLTANAKPVQPAKYSAIYSRLFRVSVPIVLFSTTVPLIYLIDSSITIGLLQGDLGYESAKEALGILGGRAQSLAGIPIILAIALSQSAVPVVSAAFARKDMALVRQQASKALYLSVVTGLPMVLAICAAARPLNGFLFGSHEGTSIIVLLTMSAMFQIVMQTSGAILMGMGRMKPLIVHVIVGIVIKLAASFLFASWLGIYGIIAATGLCFIVMAQLNLRVLRREVDYTILGRKWGGIAVTAIVSAGIGVAYEWAAYQWIQPFASRVNDMIHAVVVGGLVCLLYGGLLFVTRTVSESEIGSFPRPVQKLYRRFFARGGRQADQG